MIIKKNHENKGKEVGKGGKEEIVTFWKKYYYFGKNFAPQKY